MRLFGGCMETDAPLSITQRIVGGLESILVGLGYTHVRSPVHHTLTYRDKHTYFHTTGRLAFICREQPQEGAWTGQRSKQEQFWPLRCHVGQRWSNSNIFPVHQLWCCRAWCTYFQSLLSVAAHLPGLAARCPALSQTSAQTTSSTGDDWHLSCCSTLFALRAQGYLPLRLPVCQPDRCPISADVSGVVEERWVAEYS